MFHGNIHRHLLILSLANWAIAIVCWTISAYLGITSPTVVAAGVVDADASAPASTPAEKPEAESADKAAGKPAAPGV